MPIAVKVMLMCVEAMLAVVGIVVLVVWTMRDTRTRARAIPAGTMDGAKKRAVCDRVNSTQTHNAHAERCAEDADNRLMMRRFKEVR